MTFFAKTIDTAIRADSGMKSGFNFAAGVVSERCETTHNID